MSIKQATQVYWTIRDKNAQDQHSTDFRIEKLHDFLDVA